MTVKRHWLTLLAITILVNVPMLSSTLLFAHDTLHAFAFFRFFYTDLVLHREVPRWIPYLGYGTVFDVNLFNTILPTDYVVMAVGWVCGVKDTLLLFKISMILCQVVLVQGLFLLSLKCFTSMYSVYLVCLGALLTTSWMLSEPWYLTSYYMLPLVLWLVLRFMEARRPAALWLAGLVEGLSLLGTIPYIAPLHLFIVTAFLVPFFWRQPGLFWVFLNWRNFLHPLFFLMCGYYLLLYYWIAGIDVIWTAPGRDPATGNVTLETFLGRDLTVAWRQPLGVFLRMLARGDLYYFDYATYAGILPLVAVFYALLRRRDTLFLSMVAASFALFWFALGGWFSAFMFWCFPLMKKYRYISEAWVPLRIFLLFLGGFGVDQLLRDLRGSPAPAAPVMSRNTSWVALTVVLMVLACCALDHYYNARGRAYFTSVGVMNDEGEVKTILFAREAANLDYWNRMSGIRFHNKIFELDKRIEAVTAAMKFEPTLADRLQTLIADRENLLMESQVLLTLRYVVYLAVFGFLWLLIRRERSFPCASGSCGAKRARWVGTMLLAVFLADTGFYFSQVLRAGPWCPPEATPGDAFDVDRTIYRPQRHMLQEMPDDAAAILKIIVSRRGGSPGHNYIGSAYVLMQADPIVPDGRLDLVMPAVDAMIEARRRPGRSAMFSLMLDVPWQRSAGLGRDKARLIRDSDVTFAADEKQALADFKALARPDRQVIIEGTPPAIRTAAETGSGTFAKVEVDQFTANRVEFLLPAGASGWLFYADAYDPAWKASVDGNETKVYRANVGFKAVYVPKGASRVAFHYDGGWRDLHGLALVLLATLLAFALTGFLMAAPWLLHLHLESTAAPVSEELSAENLGKVRNWLAFAMLTALAAFLFMVIDSFVLVLLLVALAGFAVLLIQTRFAACRVALPGKPRIPEIDNNSTRSCP